MLKITILGTGNMGFHLAIAFQRAHIVVHQIFSRNIEKARALSEKVGARAVDSYSSIDNDATIYILCVADDAIEEVASQLSLCIPRNKIIAHTSGTVSSDVFKGLFSNYGCFYPLQSVRKDRIVDFKEVPVFIAGSNSHSLEKLHELGDLISDRIVDLGDADRAKLHIPAVMVNNFVNYFYIVARNYCQKEGLSFEWLIPLIDETAQRIVDGEIPDEMQTGPAIRNDIKTIRAHLKLLNDHPDYRNLYNYLSSRIKRSSS